MWTLRGAAPRFGVLDPEPNREVASGVRLGRLADVRRRGGCRKPPRFAVCLAPVCLAVGADRLGCPSHQAARHWLRTSASRRPLVPFPPGSPTLAPDISQPTAIRSTFLF